jgi:hypothetical protein
MDLSKYNKPIHFTCPKCRADFEFNGGDLVRQKNQISEEMQVLTAKMQACKEEQGKNEYYHRLVRRYEEKKSQLMALKHAIQLASEQSEVQLFILFKKECMRRYGKEEIIKILKECENEMCFRTYDMAIQDHNTFDGM